MVPDSLMNVIIARQEDGLSFLFAETIIVV
jgi:hypothetical protein